MEWMCYENGSIENGYWMVSKNVKILEIEIKMELMYCVHNEWD